MKLSIGSWFDSKRFLAMFSLIIAAFVWLATTVLTQTETDYYIHNVPIIVTQNVDSLIDRGLNLNAIIDKDERVTVQVRGPRTVLASLTADDFIVSARLNSVTEPGIYDLPLEITTSPRIESMEISLLGLSPTTTRVRFDSMATRTFTLEPIVSDLSTPADYMSEPERLTPSRVTVTGPYADIDRIERAVVKADFNEPLTRTFVADLPIQLLDAQGETINIDSRHMVMDNMESQLRITVRKLRTLPLTVRFIAPLGFPIDELNNLMQLSDYHLAVAGPVDIADNYHELMLGYINLSDLTPQNNTFTFQVELPSASFVNVNNVDVVTADFVTNNWTTQSFNLSLDDTSLVNIPHNYSVTLLTTSLPGVTMAGDKKVLEGLTANDIVATINLADRELRLGQHNYPVSISAPTKGLVWSVGEHFAVIQVTAAE